MSTIEIYLRALKARWIVFWHAISTRPQGMQYVPRHQLAHYVGLGWKEIDPPRGYDAHEKYVYVELRIRRW